MSLITFGRFGNEEDWKKDKKILLDFKKRLVLNLSGYEISYESANKKTEKEINELIKKLIKEKKYLPHFESSLLSFM